MPGSVPRVYWDTSCFLNLINRSADWFPTLESLYLDAANARTTDILTSVLTITEVAFAAIEKYGREFDHAKEAEIDALWDRTPGVTLGEFSQPIAREARRLRREEMLRDWRSVKTPDLIHLATAVRMNAERVFTTDKRLHRYGELIGIPVQYPYSPQFVLPGLT